MTHLGRPPIKAKCRQNWFEPQYGKEIDSLEERKAQTKVPGDHKTSLETGETASRRC